MGMFLRRGSAPHRTRLSDLEIGQTIKLNLNGTPWDWVVVNQGLPSSIYDASCDGTWLLLKGVYENRQWNSTNANNPANSTIHSYLNGSLLSLFDANILNSIKQVKVPYRNGGGSGGTDQIGANGLTTKVFLLSSREVGFTNSVGQSSEDGAALDYFDGATNSTRIAQLNGAANSWWLRSPTKSYTTYVLYVGTDGDYGLRGATTSQGIRPAIILPSDMLVTDDMLAA